ncbi:WD_REPEATS_REGION domain-containing protein, partial [Haematococcus lacustris]
TGHKLLTTCQDNRLRVWDHVAISPSGTPPDHEHVHSHDFNRYLTPFKGEWDPKDLTESRVVIGRYISDDYDGVALHPVDIIDITSGALLAALVDHNLTTISPVNKPHPRRDVIVSGSSSDDYDGVALHPVDIIDITSGALLAALVDHNLTTISPVNKPHPRRDVIVSGSS